MNTAGLLGHQPAAAEHLLSVLQSKGAAIDASDTGTGKTYTACALVRELGLPTLVVSPKTVVPAWNRVAEALGTGVSAINYEMLRTGKTPYGRWVPGANNRRRWEFSPEVKFAVFDEVHRCKGLKTQNAAMLMSAKAKRLKILCLSATIGSSPMDLRALGYVVGLHDGSNFYRWAMNNGAQKLPWGGFGLVGSAQEKLARMAKIHAEIFPENGVRVRIADLPDFPDCSVTTELCSLGEEAQLEALYESMAKEIEVLRQSQESDKGLAVTRTLRARQEIELLKVPGMAEMARDAIEDGLSVALFVNFNATVDALMHRLNTSCSIRGGQTEAERSGKIAKFIGDVSRVIVCNIAAGGVGVSLHDLRGEFPRLALISPGWSASELRQAMGRVWRMGAKTKATQRFLFADCPTERRLHGVVSRNLDQLDALQDADLVPSNLKLSDAA